MVQKVVEVKGGGLNQYRIAGSRGGGGWGQFNGVSNLNF